MRALCAFRWKKQWFAFFLIVRSCKRAGDLCFDGLIVARFSLLPSESWKPVVGSSMGDGFVENLLRGRHLDNLVGREF